LSGCVAQCVIFLPPPPEYASLLVVSLLFRNSELPFSPSSSVFAQGVTLVTPSLKPFKVSFVITRSSSNVSVLFLMAPQHMVPLLASLPNFPVT
jgi:hypothetical protein